MESTLPGERLKWAWVIDYYHACEYIYKLAEALYSDDKCAEAGRGRCAAG